MAHMDQLLSQMVPAPAAVAAVKTIYKTEDGILICYGTTFPADTSTGYAPSCIFFDIANGVIYVNEGTAASSDFNDITLDE